MDHPISFRPGKHGAKLNRITRRTGLKQPDIIKLALAELFKAYPDNKALALAVYEYRATEAAK